MKKGQTEERNILKKIISLRCHYLMMCNNEVDLKDIFNLNCQLIKVSGGQEFIKGTYSIDIQKSLYQKNQNKMDTFILIDECGNSIATASVMYKKGNELEYRIRKIDAFLFNVYVNAKYRHKGYADIMMKLIQNYLLEKKGIKRLLLAVSVDNEIAIKTYKKNNFKVIGKRIFIRVLRHNFPYYKL